MVREKSRAAMPLSPFPAQTAAPARRDNRGFLFVGQLVRGKGVDTLLNAFAKLQSKESLLDICGDGKQREELEEKSKGLGISSRIKFHGKVTADELSHYYDNAYAVVIPSRAPETFNLVGVEAMKHAKAVIATDVGGIKDLLLVVEREFWGLPLSTRSHPKTRFCRENEQYAIHH